MSHITHNPNSGHSPNIINNSISTLSIISILAHSPNLILFKNSTVHTSPVCFSIVHISRMVHIDIFDPTHRPQQPNIMALHIWLGNSTDLVCHVTSQHGAYRHVRPNTSASVTHYHGIVSLALQQC